MTYFIKPLPAANEENRALAAFPKVDNVADVLNFPDEFSDWFSDHLFLKSEMVMAKSELEAKIFKEIDSEKVILGDEKYLFNKSDDGQPLETYKGINRFTDDELIEIAGNINNLKNDLASVGIDFVLVIATDKEEVLGEKYMPKSIRRVNEESIGEQFAKFMEANYPDTKIVYAKDLASLLGLPRDYIYKYIKEIRRTFMICAKVVHLRLACYCIK